MPEPIETDNDRGYRFEVVDGPDGEPALARVPAAPELEIPEQSDVQMALDTLDDLMNASEPLSGEDLDAIDAWANNAQLDIMRLRRMQAGRGGRSNG